MAVSIVVQLLASALMASAAQDSGAPAAAPPAPACGSPIYDPKHDCRVMEAGSAKLLCTVLADGTLHDCTVVSEDPPGKGFGEAALASSSHTKVRADPNRPAAGIRASIPFNFKPDQ